MTHTNTSSIDAEKRREHRTKQFELWTKFLGFLTAALLLVLAVISYFARDQSQLKEKAQTQAEDLSGDVNKLDEKIGSLENDKATLSRQNTDLQAKLDVLVNQLADVGMAPKTTVTTPSLVPAVRHSGALVITSSTRDVDLDAPSSDPQWGRANTSVGADVSSIRNGGMIGLLTGRQGVMMDSFSGYFSCESNPSFERSPTFEISRLRVGNTLCVRTDKGRIAALQIKSALPEKVSVDITTWELPS